MTANLGGHGHQLPWEHSTPFKERELGAVQRPVLPLAPEAFAGPSLHLPGTERPDPHLGSQLSIFWHLHFLDVTLGKSISLNRFLHLKYGNNTCLIREELDEVMCVKTAWQKAPFKEWQWGIVGKARAPESGCLALNLAPPLTLWVSLKARHQCLFCKMSCRYLPCQLVGLRAYIHSIL